MKTWLAFWYGIFKNNPTFRLVLGLAVDAIEIFMWWRTGAESMAILAMWALFFVDGCYCFGLWLRPDERR